MQSLKPGKYTFANSIRNITISSLINESPSLHTFNDTANQYICRNNGFCAAGSLFQSQCVLVAKAALRPSLMPHTLSHDVSV